MKFTEPENNLSKRKRSIFPGFGKPLLALLMGMGLSNFSLDVILINRFKTGEAEMILKCLVRCGSRMTEKIIESPVIGGENFEITLIIYVIDNLRLSDIPEMYDFICSHQHRKADLIGDYFNLHSSSLGSVIKCL